MELLQNFVADIFKEGVFPIEMSKMIGSAFTIRNASG